MDTDLASTGRSYRVVAGILGCVLLVAGGLKLYAAATPDRRADGPAARTLPAASGAAELLFGGWMLAGFAPRGTRLVAMAVFIALSNVALYKALAGEKSCGCLGQVRLEPWVAVGLDAVAALALLLSRPGSSAESFRRGRRVGLALWCAAVAAGVLAALAPLLHRPAAPPGAASTPSEQDLLERVIRDIEANGASYQSLQFEADAVLRNPTIKEDQTESTPLPGGGSAVVRFYARQEYRCKLIVAGSNFRWEQTRDGALTTVHTITDEYWTQYRPQGKRAWIRNPEVNIAVERAWGPDRSTWSLMAPVARPRDWFARVKVRAVREVREENRSGIEVETESPPADRLYWRYVTFFSTAHRHLPVRHEQWYRDGWISRVVEIEYQHLPGPKAWMPRFARTRMWPGGKAKAPDPETLVHVIEFSVRPGVRVDAPVDDDAFRVTLPRDTYTTDVTQAPGMTAPLPAPATGPREARELLPAVPPAALAVKDLPRPSVWPLVGWNAALMVVCVVFRSRLVG